MTKKMYTSLLMAFLICSVGQLESMAMVTQLLQLLNLQAKPSFEELFKAHDYKALVDDVHAAVDTHDDVALKQAFVWVGKKLDERDPLYPVLKIASTHPVLCYLHAFLINHMHNAPLFVQALEDMGCCLVQVNCIRATLQPQGWSADMWFYEKVTALAIEMQKINVSLATATAFTSGASRVDEEYESMICDLFGAYTKLFACNDLTKAALSSVFKKHSLRPIQASLANELFPEQLCAIVANRSTSDACVAVAYNPRSHSDTDAWVLVD
jgi:hypothetical protein